MSIDLPPRVTLKSIDLPLSRILDEVQSVVLERHAKYGPTNISNSPGGPLNGLRVRLHDKLARLNNAVDNHGYGDAVDSDNADFDDDSFRDCFIDLVGYGLIGLLVVDGNWPSGTEKPEKPLADLVDRDQVARVLASSGVEAVTPKVYRLHGLTEPCRDPKDLDLWVVGTTYKPDFGNWTWHRKADGWVPTRPDGSVVPGEKHPSLRHLLNEFYPGDDGTITEPSNTLQKEAA